MTKRKERKKEERAAFGRRGSATRYMMRQHLVSFGDDFFIENQDGERVFKVDGKILRIRETLLFKDMNGNVLCKIQEKLLTIKDVMAIEDAKGKTIAKVKKAIISPLRDRWDVTISNGKNLKVQGNILDHSYEIHEGKKKTAEVSKKWFRLRDSYGVDIAPNQNDALILAITVVLDMMAHNDNKG